MKKSCIKYMKKNKGDIFKHIPPSSRHTIPSIINSRIPTILLKPCRQDKESRIPNEEFITAIRRSHRMPILPINSKLTCKCGKEIDQFGDHFFKCTHHSKTQIHNQIRDTIHNITQKLGTHANFIMNQDSCLKEENGILPTYPLLRPGDITFHPNNKTQTYKTNYKNRKIAIDITIINHRPTKQKTPNDLEEATQNYINHHLKMEAKKYNRPSQKINNINISGENIINEINKENIVLKAFTIDQFGTLGPQANEYFNNIKKNITIEDETILKRFTKPGLIAYKRNLKDKTYKNIFKHANEGWNLTHKNTWFGNTYQTTCPSTWGSLLLNTQINHALTKHIHKALKKLQNNDKNKTENKLNTRTGFFQVENDAENNMDNKQPSHRKHKEKEKPNSDQNTKEDQHNTNGKKSIPTNTNAEQTYKETPKMTHFKYLTEVLTHTVS